MISDLQSLVKGCKENYFGIIQKLAFSQQKSLPFQNGIYILFNTTSSSTT